MLRHNLPEYHLLGEVLRADSQAVLLGAARSRKAQQNRRYPGDNRRSIHPNPPSAISAINAAGTAPARSCVLSTEAIPRKIKTPSPPPPIAAAIVAVPTVVTVATRMPARIVLVASGSSTIRSSCPEVIPIAVADSLTAGSTCCNPTSVFRMIGSSA